MKSTISRFSIILIIISIGTILPGCQSNQDSGQGNSAMSAQQKAVLADHKKKQDE